MNAKEARELADESTYIIAQELQCINMLASEGKYEFVHSNLTKPQICRLEELGYSVYPLADGRDVIKW